MLVRQASNVLALLEYFAELKRPASMPEIAAAMTWPRSSTHNLLTTLADRGFLYEPRPRAGYYPTPKWITLIQSIAETGLLPNDLSLVVLDVARATGETVAVAAPARTNAVFLFVVESSALIRFAAHVGYQVPIHATSCGRALLAQYTPGERESLLKKVKYHKFAQSSLMDAASVEAEIKRAGPRGWHQNIDGHSSELTGISMSVGLRDRRLSVVVGGPTNRMKGKLPEVAATLRASLERHGFSPTA